MRTTEIAIAVAAAAFIMLAAHSARQQHFAICAAHQECATAMLSAGK